MRRGAGTQDVTLRQQQGFKAVLLSLCEVVRGSTALRRFTRGRVLGDLAPREAGKRRQARPVDNSPSLWINLSSVNGEFTHAAMC